MRKVTVARMTVIDIDVRRGNPLEVVERVASTHQWSFERAGEDELTIVVRGKWTDYQVSFTWMFDIEVFAPSLRLRTKSAGTQPG